MRLLFTLISTPLLLAPVSLVWSAEPTSAEPRIQSILIAQADSEARGGLIRRRPPPAADEAPDAEPETQYEPEDRAVPSEAATRRQRGAAPREADAPGPHYKPQMSDIARLTSYDDSLYSPDPDYEETEYDPAAQYEIYGGKSAISTPRPLLELGYPMYAEGVIGHGSTILGEKNRLRPQFLVYGDFQLTPAFNDDGLAVGPEDETGRGVLATRLNLDLDLKLTATERLHVLLRPLDEKGRFTRYEFHGGAADAGEDVETEFNLNPVTAFFEGDMGAILQGITGSYNQIDLPFAVGLVPLLFQNGVWMDDAITGLAFSIPARSSTLLDITNMDTTFFAGFDRVDSPMLARADGRSDSRRAQVYGVATFIEARQGYFEFGYGYLNDRPPSGDVDLSYHSLTGAYTRRYRAWVSNSIRLVASVGQDSDVERARSADGAALLIENSLITRRPYTLVPYFNFFVATGTPQSLARAAGAGGLLKNVGINFETDGLSGFPKIDDSAADAYGGALGLQYLFNLDQQIVVELATVQRTSGPVRDTADYALGVRWQRPITRRMILRFDAMGGIANQGDDDIERTLTGARAELRVKF